MRRLIGVIVDGLVLLLALGTLLVYAQKQHWLKRGPVRAESFYRLGRPLEGVNVRFADADVNLVLALSSKCEFCAASAPFFRRLVREVEGRSRVRIIAIFREDADAGRSYLTNMGVESAALTVIGSALNYPGKSVATPTLLVVGRDGTVLKAWVGKLGEGQEAEVFSSLTPPLGNLEGAIGK